MNLMGNMFHRKVELVIVLCLKLRSGGVIARGVAASDHLPLFLPPSHYLSHSLCLHIHDIESVLKLYTLLQLKSLSFTFVK